ncbi:transcription elongation factor GreA [Buchnera aphidicola (Ceratoglyphina bambusae)]|uniref:transcription elongation factor GreA n=1 Tax=Buchnera aphidicola TaxID=9 RepID=UPI0031B82749
MANYTPITILGYKKLKDKLYDLKNFKRKKIIDDIKKARQHGDLKENAEYHAARNEQSFCEGKIKEIENKLSNVNIIDITKIPNKNKVVFGVTVSILNTKTKKKFVYKIVGEDEANFKNNFISVISPISRGLIGKFVGDNVLINTPKGKMKYKIIKVEHI